MADSNVPLQWTDDQWNRVRQVVYEEARRARVAGNVLPLYGPLERDARYVSKELVYEPNDPSYEVPGLTVGDTDTLKLSTLQVHVYLRGAQVADPELTSALMAFRRAASMVARLEDDIIFRGQPGPSEEAPPKTSRAVAVAAAATKAAAATPPATAAVKPAPKLVLGGQANEGLLEPRLPPKGGVIRTGNDLVTAVSNAISVLEQRRHFGPFVCALDHKYFELAQTPNKDSLVLPQDRILPFLGGGALVRASSLWDQSGVVVALAGAPIDLVVATDISVSFLQLTVEPWFVFRVFEKIVLRIKQPEAIEAL